MVMVMSPNTFLSMANLLPVKIFWDEVLLVWTCWVRIHRCIDVKGSSLTGSSGRSPGYYVSQELPLNGTLIQARGWDF